MGLRVNPTYRQRRLGAEIRKLREQAGLSVSDAARLMGVHAPHLSNIEAGRTSLSDERLCRFADAIGCTSTPFLGALRAMGQDAGKGWWTEYRKAVGASHLDLAELEASAANLCNYEPLYVPGLLQTRDYATAIHRGSYAIGPSGLEDDAVGFRMQRQGVLRGQQPSRLHAIVHESALRVQYGGREVMRDQLLKLIELSRLPNVTVQVFPLNAPAPAFAHPFMVIRPSVEELSTVLVDQLDGSSFLGEALRVGEYRATFGKLSELALPPVDAAAAPEARRAKDSLGLIQHIMYPLL